jgi:hypothetical protein
MMGIQKRCAGALVLLVMALPAFAGQPLTSVKVNQVTKVLNRHIAALQKGDVSALKSTLGGQAYSEYKTLLEQNTEYPDFLRNYYKGASFQIGDITPGIDDDVIAQLKITLANSGATVTRLRVAPDGKEWKIVAVLPPGRSTGAAQ